MISNRHIPNGWQTFLNEESDSKRVMACGVRSYYKNFGIPGVTPQPSNVDGRGGWCEKCSYIALGICVQIFKAEVPEELLMLYKRAAGALINSNRTWENYESKTRRRNS